MRVLQLIDSLRPGGAERMAVNVANALEPHLDGSFLCCTRMEGFLKAELKTKVGYLFLNKKSSLDPKAILRLRNYIIDNKIDIIHAHGTSWFFATLLRLTGCKIKLVWHDHYGESENLKFRNSRLLKLFSKYFDGIVSVNSNLKKWAENKLHFNPVIHLNNFIIQPKKYSGFIKLKGTSTDFKIICVANLRPQKDHLNLIKAFEISSVTNHNLTLHLVGEDPGTSYSKKILDNISSSMVADKIFFYGSQKNIPEILKQANLGVLASRSEGMPLVLLEYGMTGLPVISTNVGQCAEVLGTAGITVPSYNPKELAEAILSFGTNQELCLTKGVQIKNRIKTQFSENSYRQDLLEFYKKI